MTTPSGGNPSGLPVLAALSVVVFLAGFLQLSRTGYSPDEEFTVFAVKGIAADGLPLLPSGLLYDRGVAYSYASRLARAVSGSELPAYRAISLLSAMAILGLVFAIVRRLASVQAALIASLLVSTSIPFWAAATTGRFYAPFFACYLGALLALSTLGTFGPFGALAVLSLLARWTHELAFTLLAVPALAFVLAPKSERRMWLRASVAVAVGLVVAQAGLLALHYLAPSSGETMVRRFFLWQVLNLFEVPPDRQFGIVLAVTVIAWLVAPRRAGLTTVIALCGVSMVLAFALARATNAAPLSRELVVSILVDGSRYPLDMFWHIARTSPFTLVTAMGLLIVRLAGAAGFDARRLASAGGEWRAPERAVHLVWIGWVLWFGVIESGITVNYLLVPVSLMLAAIAVDLAAVLDSSDRAPRRGRTRPVRVFVTGVVVVAIALDQWRGAGSIPDRLAAARPTIVAPGIDEIRDGLQQTDRVACTDELGCLMLVGRIDMWLALDDYVRERFLVKRGDEQFVGVYTGAPAVFRPADLFAPGSDGTIPDRTLIVDVFKEYPIGNSRSWLPRAIELDGLEVKPLLETPQLRVLQVSPPIGHAAR